MANVDNLAGTEIQGWSLLREIGRGADGIVYAGSKDGTEAAVKIFFPDALEKNGLLAARERLELQLGLIGKKHHQNLVEVYAGGEVTSLSTLFLIMELVQGTSLDKLIGKVPPSAVPRLMEQLASAAEFLESQDLIHRDIKPANIVISDDFQMLTLLDLGIVYQLPDEDDKGRLSGKEFVATLRYSPPEFVWRTEEGNVDGAWRAITFYQIGATLHDMIMGKVLFCDCDTPRALLYDAVREKTPDITSKDIDSRIVHVAQACLLKDWRQRLQFVSWESFRETVIQADAQQQERKIRLHQLRKEEERQASLKHMPKSLGPTRKQQLWQLNNSLSLEVRNYLLNATIFPPSHVHEDEKSSGEYVISVHFDDDPSRGFQPNVVFSITICIDPMLEAATKLTFSAMQDGASFASSAWTEMFTVDSAFSTCRQAFLNAVESMLLI